MRQVASGEGAPRRSHEAGDRRRSAHVWCVPPPHPCPLFRVPAGTVIEVNVSELGLVTPGGKVVWGKHAQASVGCRAVAPRARCACLGCMLLLLLLMR